MKVQALSVKGKANWLLVICHLLLVIFTLYPLPFTLPVYAAKPFGTTTGNQPAQLKDLEVVFANIINVAVALAIIALLVTIVMAGFKYLTSAGDPKATQQAGQALTFAFVGMTLFILAWFILLLVKQITGVDVTIFKIVQ
ncbi:hypothetical protein HY388_01525 [Candidatus Daviesbacteria bacterium]|nr:hypothetical protein [Candidatus Daviesbacteria bacterium]